MYDKKIREEQVRQAYALSPFGILATVINALIVFFVMKNVVPQWIIVSWLTAVLAVSLVRAAIVLLYQRAGQGEASVWEHRFLAGLSIIGLIWGSFALFPLSDLSPAYHVFIAFVLGGMAAGAAATFSVLERGFQAYSIPALTPLMIRFFLMGDSLHYAMGGMLLFYVILLWRISDSHYQANRTSLLLRYENVDIIESLKSAREELLAEMAGKLKAEDKLRAHQEQLEETVKERTNDLVRTNAELKVQIQQRKQTEERLALAQKSGRVGVFDLDLISRKAFWTAQLEELFGISPGGFEGTYTAWFERIHPEDREWIGAQFQTWMHRRESHVEFEYRIIRADGETRWMAASGQFTYLSDGTPARFIGTNVDSTERKRLEAEIMHMAHHDTLTGLPNRRLFLDIVNLEMVQARRNQHKLALLFLDLDRFKEINDTLGHAVGDELLKEVSRRLRGSIRESDSAARIGGDEFNIVLADINRPDDITVVTRKIMAVFNKAFTVGGYPLQITASIGISVYPDDAQDLAILFRYADIAMYHAKERGRNSFQFYNSDINIRSIERIRFESHLRQALARDELRVYYQPQVLVQSGRLVGAEALVRWRHPELGFLNAGAFVPAAESIGFIAAIDEWVLKTACAQFKQWTDKGHAPLTVAVNLSSRIFRDRDLVEIVSRILDETGLPPERLELEITESIAMDDIESTILILGELSRNGIGISIDDFGTGYSSLSYLKRLPIHRLKIDQSFVKDITTDPDDRAIIQAVTAMAHSMKISVVAEGVETEDQLAFLRSTQCHGAQGFLFSKSLPAEEFMELMPAVSP